MSTAQTAHSTDEEIVLQLIQKAAIEELPSLDLSGRQLISLPVELFNLKNLKSLNLRGNQLKTLPPNIKSIMSLVWLDVSHNQLVEIPSEIGCLENLTSLNLSHNKILKIPTEIKNLSQLTSLDLGYNRLTILPKAIGSLKKMTQVDLSNNRIKCLPFGVSLIEGLTWLYLNNNKIATLPARISRLKNLSELHLRNNQIAELPLEITELTNLTELDLRENQLCWPDNIIENTKQPDSILSFRKQLHGQEEEYLYEAKILLVGEAGAGKTSLAKKIVDNQYQLCSDEESTVGIDVSAWYYEADAKQFRVNIWDFSGQEIDYATHQFFLTDQSLYLLVSDSRKEDTNFYYWLGVVQSQSLNSPLLIIKNEKQGRHREIGEFQLKKKFDNLKEIIPTDLLDNRGLSDVLTSIKNQISQLPHIGRTLPKQWVKVREALERNCSNYISRKTFFEICNKYGFADHEAKLQLSRHLHLLGVCIHFQDDTSLSEIVFLNPMWLTNAIYKVLDDSQIKQNRGEFDKASLDRIWNEDEYGEMRSKLLELMLRFRMCYEIPSKKSYIAPQLLDINPPEYEWDSSDNLVLKYQYQFMPKGILSQLIVQMNQLVYEGCVWKNGAVLYQDEAKAEVIEEYKDQEGTIIIRVSGKRKPDLLSSIIYEIDNKIHAGFNNVKYEKLVPCRCVNCRQSEEPSIYKLQALKERIDHGKSTIECGCPPSYEDVNIPELIGYYNMSHVLDINSTMNRVIVNIENVGNLAMADQREKVSNTYQKHAGQGDNIAGNKEADR